MSDKESKEKLKSSKQEALKFLLGEKKAQFIRYCLNKKSFYQAEAAFDLHWHISTTQYYLRNFVKYGLLIVQPTRYKTYYQINPAGFPNLFLKSSQT